MYCDGLWIYEEQVKNKIIASTDKNITPDNWIAQDDIKWIVEHYNKHGELPEVDLKTVMTKNISHIVIKTDMCYPEDVVEFGFKTNPDGSIMVIRPEPKLYTEKELIDWMAKMANEVRKNGCGGQSSAHGLASYFFNNFLKNNNHE